MSLPAPKTPDEALAERIVAHLIEAGLVLPAKADELRGKVATGRARIEDWQRWVEQAIEQKAKIADEADCGQA